VANPDDPDEVADAGLFVARYADASLTAEEVLSGPPPDRGSRESDVLDFLEGFLGDGPRPASEVLDAAAEAGIPEATLKRHKRGTAVSFKDGQVWMWRLRDER
jgi:hypothetical protein